MDFKRYSELFHYGVKGMHWGIRRYQNVDGTLTPLGKKRKRETVFVSGSSKTQFEDSGYYRKDLPKDVRKKINEYIKNGDKIIVGDAPGIDRQVQDYLKKKRYKNVEVYGPGNKQVRYSANKKWKTKLIDAPEFEENSPEWLAKKDKAMTKVATKGLSIVLDDGSMATKRNVARLLSQHKNVDVYELNKEYNKDHFVDEQYIQNMLNMLDQVDRKKNKHLY